MTPLSARRAVVLALSVLSGGLHAQTSTSEPQQVVNLSASAWQQASQDWLRVVVRSTQEGAEPAGVQKQLKSALDEALIRLRPQVQARQLEVHSGAFSVQPRYNDKGKIVGWQGQADLVIEGRDFARIGQAAAQVPRMVVESAQFSLSREGRQQLEAEVQSQAVQGFRQKAQQLAKDFGFNGYALRQVTVGTVDRPTPALPMLATARAAMAESTPSPIPLEGGKDEVRITVSGSIQLR